MRNIRDRLSENLRLLRKSREDSEGKVWSIGDLAERSGVSAGAIQKIEAGNSWPDWKTLELLARALTISVDSLFESAPKTPLSEAVQILNNVLLKAETPFRIEISEGEASRMKILKDGFDSEFFESQVSESLAQAEEILSVGESLMASKKSKKIEG
jgi:transcriptional regulator with XRE-family HTH domain